MCFSSIVLNGAEIWDRLGINLAKYVNIPKNLWSSSLFFGGDICVTATIFFVSGFMSSLLSTYVADVTNFVLPELAFSLETYK